MVILIEGPDGSGKTTLAGQLMLLGFGYVHMSVPRPARNPLTYWLARFKGRPHPLVIDRMHWSEDVYGPLTRGGSALSDLDRWVLEGWLMAHDAKIVLCLPPVEAVLENVALDSGAPNHADAGLVRAVYEEYRLGRDVPGHWPTSLPVLNYDYTAEKATALLRRLGLATSRALPADHEGIGSPRPPWVFVGDRHGSCRGPCGVPFVFRSACGDYLRRALCGAGLGLADYHVLDGWLWNDDGTVRPHDIFGNWQWRLRPHIALGRSAECALAEARITPWASLPHPQYWSRFRGRDLDGYVRLIREALHGG